MIFVITIGDWSEDGHSKYREFYYETTFTLKQLRTAYTKGAKQVNIDLFEECQEYEQYKLSEEAAKYFNKEDEDGYVSPEEFADCVIYLIKQGDNTIHITKVKAQMFNGYWCKDTKFNLQLGYGLF